MPNPPDMIANYQSAAHGHLNAFFRRNATLGESPRFLKLDWYEQHFRALEYEQKRFDFQGRALDAQKKPQGPLHAMGLPPGYQDHQERGINSLPLGERRPPGPARLGRTIVKRFTGMLFSEHKRPSLRVHGDKDTEDYLDGIIKAGNLWARMQEARDNGGAMGSTIVTFGFNTGKPAFEVHNAKHCFPTWKDRTELELDALDVVYKFPREVRTRKGYATLDYWYRRRIDDYADIVFEPVEVRTGEDPEWKVANVAIHNFGEFPGVWIQNEPDSEAIDGPPDCEGQFEAIAAYDALKGLAQSGTLPNADPTLLIKTLKKLEAVRKGSRNAIQLDPGDDARYLELVGTGANTALTVAAAYKADILEAVACVLKDEGTAATATEIRHRYRAMFDRVDIFRLQYGNGLKTLLQKVDRAARLLAETIEPELDEDVDDELSIDREMRSVTSPPGLPATDGDGPEDPADSAKKPYIRTLALPPKLVQLEDDPDGDGPLTTEELQPRVLGPGGDIEIVWPEHIVPTPVEVQAMIAALTAAQTAGYIDGETAAKTFATYMGLPDGLYRKAKLEKEAKETAEMDAMMARLDAGQFGAGGNPNDPGARPPPKGGKPPFGGGPPANGPPSLPGGGEQG